MKDIRTRIIVALASSTVLASGLSMAVVAFSPGSTAAVSVADGSTPSPSASSNVIIIDP